jgi:DnaJ-class molecular chaperone
MQHEFDIETCRWCNGDGKDHGTLGMAVVRDCPRCAGSGGVRVTSRESVTGRRRVYKGPAPANQLRGGMTASLQQQELTEVVQHARRGKGATEVSRQILAPAKSAFPPSLAVTELTEALQEPTRPKRRANARSHAA